MSSARTALAAALAAGLVLLAGLAVAPARAADAAWSGFGTVGHAKSDSVYRYQRDITDEGGFRRDTLLAGQLDLRLAPHWSATWQVQLAPRSDRDQGWAPRTAWAFVGWRPDNDWLVRVGKARVPLYLYSESLDVGLASDMARMPYEMYSIAPTNDATGVFVTRTLALAAQELTLDAFDGHASSHLRAWLRDGLPPLAPPGPLYLPVRAHARGLSLTARGPSFTWRLAWVTGRSHSPGYELPATYPRVELAPGLGYWKVSPGMPGPDIPTVPAYRNRVVTTGAEWSFGDGWRLAAEAVDNAQSGAELGSASRAGYIAAFKRIGQVAPYVSIARQRSSDILLSWQRRLGTDLLPEALPGAAPINALQRSAADTLFAYDQRSVALGASWSLAATTKLKAEWMRTRVGQASAHFDAPPGAPGAPGTGGLRVHTVSVNLAFAF